MRRIVYCLFVSLLFAGTVSNSALAMTLQEVSRAAAARSLPQKILNELIERRAQVTIRKTSGGPSYQPGYFYGGTIYLPFADLAPREWKHYEWTNFYNEAFHAWWGNVFLKDARYAQERSKLLRDLALRAKYRRANPRDAALAQEEAYSETTAFVISMAYPRLKFDAESGEYVYFTPAYDLLYYKINSTVAPVSHSDRPGYTPEAESIYPDEDEYGYLMRWLFGRSAPSRPAA